MNKDGGHTGITREGQWRVEWAGIRGHTGREGALRGGELEDTLGW